MNTEKCDILKKNKSQRTHTQRNTKKSVKVVNIEKSDNMEIRNKTELRDRSETRDIRIIRLLMS